MTYFKAVRPGGTDFYTGQIDYAAACGTGEIIRPELHEGAVRMCGPGLLHAADVAAETLVGGSWPCRLFEVKGKPVAGFDEDHPHKGGFKELRVIRELPAWQALGPNGEQVAALIKRAGRLTEEEAKALSAARRAAESAWLAESTAESTAEPIARSAAWFAARRAAARSAAESTARSTAWFAARSAASALVVRDVLAPEHFDALYGPWRDVIGEPA